MRKVSLLFIFFLVVIVLYGCSNGEFIVNFDTTGGDLLPDIVLEEGELLESLPTPTREGYHFDGWYLDDDYLLLFSIETQMIEREMTLFAKWTRIVENVTISFDTDGGSLIEPMVFPPGASISNPISPSKAGNTFGGWYSDSALATAYIFTTMPVENITLYAKWTVNNYTITFNSNDGSAVANLSAAYLAAVTEPTAPTKLGHAFGGWYSDSALAIAYTFTTMPANDFTLYAKWTVNNYTITFNSNDGSDVANLSAAYLAAVTAPSAPTKLGHTFGGWYSDALLTTTYTFSTMSAENITLYAKWESAGSTMSFDSQGGTQIESIINTPGTLIHAPVVPTKEGFVFAGWYESIQSIELYEFDTMPTTNLTLYANWATEGLLYELIEDSYYEVSAGDACSLVSISIPKYHLGKQVQSIANQGFMNCSDVEEILLPKTLRKIHNRAFMYTSLTTIYIPSSVDFFGMSVFRFTHQLEEILVDENSLNYKSQDGILFSKDGLSLVRYPSAKTNTEYVIDNTVTTIGSDAFSSSFNLTSIVIGTSVNTIKDHAFYNCQGLTSIVIPNNVTTIEIYIFRDCVNLVTVQLGTGITMITSYMFDGCASLASIIIPYQVLSIGYGAFNNCTSLASIHLKRSSLDGITTGASFMLTNTPITMKIYVEDLMSVSAYKQASFWSSYQTRIELKP